MSRAVPKELLADYRLGHAAVRVACALWWLASEVDGRLVCLASAADVARTAGVSRRAVESQVQLQSDRKSNTLAATGWVSKHEHGWALGDPYHGGRDYHEQATPSHHGTLPPRECNPPTTGVQPSHHGSATDDLVGGRGGEIVRIEYSLCSSEAQPQPTDEPRENAALPTEDPTPELFPSEPCSPTAPKKQPARRKKSRQWNPDDRELDEMAKVMAELHRCRAAAGWKEYRWEVGRGHCGQLLCRMREGMALEYALDAVRAVVWKDAGPDHAAWPSVAAGEQAHLTRIFRLGDQDSNTGRVEKVARWVEQWVAAGRPPPSSTRHRPPPPRNARQSKGGHFLPHNEDDLLA